MTWNGLQHTYDTIFTDFQGITNNIYGFGRPFLLLHFFTRPPYFYPSMFVFTRPNDGWTGLYIKLWQQPNHKVHHLLPPPEDLIMQFVMYVCTVFLAVRSNVSRTLLCSADYNWQQLDIPFHIQVLLAMDCVSFSYLFSDLFYTIHELHFHLFRLYIPFIFLIIYFVKCFRFFRWYFNQ